MRLESVLKLQSGGLPIVISVSQPMEHMNEFATHNRREQNKFAVHSRLGCGTFQK